MAVALHRSLLRALLVLALCLVVAAMVVPASAIEFVLREFAWAKATARVLDTIAPGHQLDYILPFAALGFVARFGWRTGRPWQVMTGVVVVAASVELLQIWAPGREAAVAHVLLDVSGGLFGFVLAWLITYAWGSEALGSAAPPERLWYFSTMQAPSRPGDEEDTRPPHRA